MIRFIYIDIAYRFCYTIKIFLDILERNKTAAYENTIYQLSRLDPSGRMSPVSDAEGLLERECCPFHLQTMTTMCINKGYYLLDIEFRRH